MLDVLYIIGFPVQLIREVFLRLHSSVVVDRHLPRFEALAYVLPHFDALTDVVILVSSAFIFQRFAERGDEWSLRTFASMPSTAIFCEHEQV